MKVIFTLNLLLLFVLKSYSQSYILKWNSETSKYEIKGINLANGTLTNIGSSSTMSSSYDINEIYYDRTNDQIVGIYQNTDLWKYSLGSNTDQIIDLGTDQIRTLVVDFKSYLLKWNSETSKYEIKKIDLTDGTLTDIGSSSTMSSSYDINEVYYDHSNSLFVGIYQNTDLWSYNLASNTDQIVDLGSDQLRDLIVDENAYLLKWNSTTSKYEVKGINLVTGTLTNIGSSSIMSSSYDINEIYYDQANKLIVGIYQNMDLWKYSLTSNTDQIIDLGSDQLRDLEVNNPTVISGIQDPSAYEKEEIVGVFDTMGRELLDLESDKTLIVIFSDGRSRKIYIGN